MRFKKGEKVEVMNTKEVPISWCVAEILCGDGEIYRVKYDFYPGMVNGQMSERVSKKFLRPCPPEGPGVEKYIAGDIVDVFYEFSWKMASILKVIEGKKEIKRNKIHRKTASVQNQYLVRLLGCSKELTADKLNIRMRQTWIGDKWILIGKSSRGGDDVIASKPSTPNCHQKMNFTLSYAIPKKKLQNIGPNIQDDAAFQGSPIISSRSLKRASPYDSTVIEEHNGHAQKVRATEKDGRKQRMVTYPREIPCEKNMYPSLKIGYNEMERRKVSDIQTESNSSGSDDACSVGSCSITDQSPTNYCNIRFKPLPSRETETLCSDAESCSGSGSERRSSSLPPKEEVEVCIRTLELHAYRRTLEAWYASGPLSWEQEALLTNLRIMLNISNDEHLMEVKHLISAKTAIHVR